MQRNKSWFFRQNDYTKHLSIQDRERLEKVSDTLELRKRQALWASGDPANRVYFVRSGMIKIGRVTDDGRELTLHLVERKQILGEFGPIEGGVHDTVAEAYEESVLYSLPSEVFLSVMKGDSELFMAITRLIADRRRSLEARVESLLFKTAHSRLASLFLDLADRFGVRDARGIIVNLKLTHREMASLIGASRETVSFAILDLRKDGLILTEDKRVVILDEDRLRELADSS